MQLPSCVLKLPFKKIFRWALGLFAFFLFLLIGTFTLVWLGAFGKLPDAEELKKIENPTASEVYSADSVLLGRYFIFERSSINFQKIPKHVIHAVLATEDIRFYKHRGIDKKSLARVLLKSILLQQSSGGGSTLTQQLAKNLYPRQNYILFSMLVNKYREIIIASRLEEVYSKDEILTLYLNTIPFGDNTYGLEAAAQRFFSAPTHKLTVEQTAVLIGMLKANHAYNPRLFPKRSLNRRNVVLAQMVKYEMLENSVGDSLKKLPISLHYRKISHHTGIAPYFREHLRQQLVQWCKTHVHQNGKPYNLYTDGLKIYTTIDSRLQKMGEDALAAQMKIIQAKFDQHWSTKKPWHKQPTILADAINQSDRYQQLRSNGLSHDEIINIMRERTLKNVFTWNGEKEEAMTAIDSIEHHLKFLQAGLLAIEPQTGSIRTWVGGIDHHYFQYDHVKETTKRQVGSTFKPIVYAAALEKNVRPCEFISAAKTEYTDMEGWTPQNTENNYGLKYSMTGALTHSVNTVSVKILEKAGIANTIAVARKMGIESSLPAVPALALGVADISVTEMVSAYSVFANNGHHVKPFYLTSITSHDNVPIETFKNVASEKVLTTETTMAMIYMLQQVMKEGTGVGINRFDITSSIAGKTGTTQSNADGWFIGITPRLVIGAWVGADDPRIRFRSTALGQGARTAMPIVGDFLQQIKKDNTFNEISYASFPALSPAMERRLSCEPFKEDKNFIEKIFGKRSEQKKKKFGEKKKGFFNRLFGSND